MLRYLLFTSCMSSCIHCHVRMPRSGAECSPNPWCTHTHFVSLLWDTGTSALILVYVVTHITGCAGWAFTQWEKIQRAQTVFVSHRVCQQPLLQVNGFLLVKLLQWKSSPNSRTGGLWPLNSPTAFILWVKVNSPSFQKHSAFMVLLQQWSSILSLVGKVDWDALKSI